MSKNNRLRAAGNKNQTNKTVLKKEVNPIEKIIPQFKNLKDDESIESFIKSIETNLNEKKFGIDDGDDNGDTLLMHVVGIEKENFTAQKIKLLNFLIDKGAKINNASKEIGTTALSVAVMYGDLEIVKYLVEKGININKQDNDKDTPLKMAIRDGKTEIAKFLISKGSSEGEEVLVLAIKSENHEIVGILIDAGNVKLSTKYVVDDLKNSKREKGVVRSMIDFGYNPYAFLIRGKDRFENGIINDHVALIAKNNDDFLKVIEEKPSEEQIKNFVVNRPINFYVKDANGKALISNLAEKYPKNWQEILDQTIENQSIKTSITQYQDNERKKKDLDQSLTYLHPSFKSELNTNNIDLLKIIKDQDSEIKFSSKDKILEEVMIELLEEKKNSEAKKNQTGNNNSKNNPKNAKGKVNNKTISSQQTIFPSQKISPEEIAEKYIKKYCENNDLKEISIDSLTNKIKKEFGNDIAKFIFNDPRKKIELIINPNAKIVKETEKENLSKKESKEEIINTTKSNVEADNDNNESLKKTAGGGNCLIHSLTGYHNQNSGYIENPDHLLVRGELMGHIVNNLDELMSHAPDSTRTPIAISILDHFLTTARTIKSSPEREYLDDKNNQNIFQEYETAGLVLDLTISGIIENNGDAIHETLMTNGDLQNQLATILQKTPDYVINPANKDVVLKYILQNSAFRNQVLNEGLQELRTSLDVADYNLHQATKAAILQTLNYYKDDGVWLTNDFAEIHAKKNGLNVIIHTGANEERVSKFLYNQNNLDEIIHIGIRNGEGGNHFEKIDNLDLWLERERNEQTKRSNKFRDDYSLVESAATEIATQFLSYYELLSSKEKQDFCDNCIGGEQDSELLSVILQLMYGGEKNKLPDYLWEGIATELFYELAGRSGEFSVQRMASKTDFATITVDKFGAKISISALNQINKFAFDIDQTVRKEDLRAVLENNKINLEVPEDIRTPEEFLSYIGKIVVTNYKKEFIDSKEKEFWQAYPGEEKNAQYLKDRKEWMRGNFQINDKEGHPVIYQEPDFNQWKQEIINTLIFYVPEYIMGSIAKEEVAKEQNQKITLEQQGKIKNLNLNKLEEKNFAVLLSYALTTDEKSKEFLLEKIKSNMPDEEEQKAFLFKAELISDLIHEDKIPVSNIVSIFKERHEVKNKAKDQDKKDLSISYQMKKPTEMQFQTYIAKVEDIMIPSRKNDNNLKVIFTDEVKAQIDKQGQSLKDWRDIADRGLVGAVGQSGIKNLKTANHLWELKTKEEGDLKGKRCYAVQKGDTLFVIGCGDKKSQDGDIEKYGKYEIELDHKKTINTSGIISPRNASRLNDKGLEVSIVLN